MPHVDEGRLTAWLDGAIAAGDSAGQEIARHLEACADCRCRLEEARELRARTNDILATADLAAPPAPDFRRLVERARGGEAVGSGRPRRRPRVPATGLAWAASVALAVTAGWLARDLSLRRGDVPPPFAGEPAAARNAAPPERERGEGAGEASTSGAEASLAARARQKVAPAPAAMAEDAAEEAAAPALRAAGAARVDPFHAEPAPGRRNPAVAAAAAGCWTRVEGGGSGGLPDRIRLVSPAEGARGTVTEARGGALGAWTGFDRDSVWVGDPARETLRLRLDADLLVGRTRPRAPSAAETGRADAAASAPAVWRRVRCEP